ncbi:DUF3310 domain-containing protein [Bifidobacterium catenulatum subsp. kashiwanohense]|uniref:DUF3310 domain-containing protein n=1 Tax=Bifidobacterium catenulatum TaxID=1686 RepID=UPI003D04FE6D
MNRNPFEILFDNVLAGAAYASQSSDSASVKEPMDNVNHPKHYEDGPFECIELSRLLSSDWGQVVQYCFRWQHKNGVEDLKKALWFINDAIDHNVPAIAAWSVEDAYVSDVKAARLLEILETENWADLGRFWREFQHGTAGTVRLALAEKINEIEKEGK